jgi:DNA-binding transcriptional ArsR family regulator/rhodanese-related sulfurtransferase
MEYSPATDDPKEALYEQFARVGKVLGNPGRLELLHLLGQGERSVESLAKACGLGITTTSAHLQTLRQARLVDTRREGVRVFYRLADDSVYRLLVALQDVGRSRLAEVQQIVRDCFESKDDLKPVGKQELWDRIQRGDVVVLDVRPPGEYRAGHIPHAISIPVEELASRLGTLPRNAAIVAYCRGPYCVLATEALEILRTHGRRARRLEDGFPEWRLSGLPVEVAAS